MEHNLSLEIVGNASNTLKSMFSDSKSAHECKFSPSKVSNFGTGCIAKHLVNLKHDICL